MKTIGLLFLLTFGSVVLAQQNEQFANMQKRLAGEAFPHVLGAIVSIGTEPKYIVQASKTPADINVPVDIRSVTKSITALLFGVDNAKINNKFLNSAVTQHFTSFVKSSDERNNLKRKITLDDLFTMRSGLACNDWTEASIGHEDKMYSTQNWLAFWSSLPISHQPGKHFSYCTGNVIALGIVLTNLAKQSVGQYANTHLFLPLEITQAKWKMTPQGHTDTGGHLKLGVADLHKIGVLILNNGRWNAKQVVSPDWIQLITRAHTKIEERKERYGMLWWTIDVPIKNKLTPIVYAHGNGGNYMIVVPEFNTVAAFTGDAYNSREQFKPFRFFVSNLLPVIATIDKSL